MPAPSWLDEPEDHDYAAAADYLTLLVDAATAAAVVDALRGTVPAGKKAKDILRASGLVSLGEDNVHVKRDLHKIDRGEPLSPVLLVRGNARTALPLIIADGYHRVCAVDIADEDATIPCRLAPMPD